MKNIIIALLSLCLADISVNAQEKKIYKDDYIVKTGDMAPDFVINEAAGKSYRLSDFVAG